MALIIMAPRLAPLPSRARCYNLRNGREATRWQLPLGPKQSCQTHARSRICPMEHQRVTPRNGKNCTLCTWKGSSITRSAPIAYAHEDDMKGEPLSETVIRERR